MGVDSAAGDREALLIGGRQATYVPGPTVLPDATRFTVWAPRASSVRVHVQSGNAAGSYALRRLRDGWFEVTVPRAQAGDDYAFSLDGGPDRPDPASRWQPHGVHGASRIVDPRAFVWHDAVWRGIDMADYVLYELHVGTFTRAGTFDGVIEHLDALRTLGVTAIELMPVAQFPGARNWGYDGVALFAPQHSYGGPRALRRLVDAAHAAGLAIVLDVVYNHFGPEGNYLPEYGPYLTSAHQTPWGDAVNFDDAQCEYVRGFVIENARYWVRDFHIDGLRLDAIHGINDRSPRHILADVGDAVHALGQELGRRVQVIAESDLNDATIVRDPRVGGYGLDAQWTDDLHHALHVTLTGERSGYYAGFDGLGDLARALQRRFVYEGQVAPHRGRTHGAPALDVSADHFVVYAQNHDQVGNRAMGDRLTTMLDAPALAMAAALVLLSPYVPLMFMGEEYGETRPFQYFVSHSDPTLVDAVRAGRRREFESFGWRNVADPQDESTYSRSLLDRSVLEQPAHAQRQALYGALLAARRRCRVLRPGAADVMVQHDTRKRWITVRYDEPMNEESAVANRLSENAPIRDARLPTPDAVVALFNFALRAQHLALPKAPPNHAWAVELSTAEERFGGDVANARKLVVPWRGQTTVRLPGMSAALAALRPVQG